MENKPEFIVFCENCGVGIAAPLWTSEDLDEFYSKGKYWANSKIEILSPKKYPVAYALAVSRWKLIEPLLREKQISILDIGAGHGFLGIVAAKSKNLNLLKYVSIEKDRTLQESLRKTWSACFPNNILQIKDCVDHIDGKFDCIILSQVLEHLTDPKVLLRIVLAKLSKKGVLFIDVPNQDYLFKKDVFPHFLFFNISSLQYLMKDCGLMINSIDCYGNDMNSSPLNLKNTSRLYSLLTKIIMTTKVVIPERFILTFFSRYFEMNKQNNNGIWIRAICQNSHSEQVNEKITIP
jgi:SAM-dependent methyltransferase